MWRRWREPTAIAAEIDRIRSLRVEVLRREWRLGFGRVPPAGLSRDLLGRMIAARLQERAFGGLDRDSLRFLESFARYQRRVQRQLKPGTVPGLMRSIAMPRRSHQTESFERLNNALGPCEGHAIVGADGKRQAAFVEQPLEGRAGEVFAGRLESFA
jgi:hypothetical protein